MTIKFPKRDLITESYVQRSILSFSDLYTSGIEEILFPTSYIKTTQISFGDT